MITRRELIKSGAIASTAAFGAQAAFAKAPMGLDALMIDGRYAELAGRGRFDIPVLRFTGDVTQVWFNTLDRAWRGRGYVLGGITGSDALFVLETLASHQGRRVTSRTLLGEKDVRGVAPVRWIIAPVHPSVLP